MHLTLGSSPPTTERPAVSEVPDRPESCNVSGDGTAEANALIDAAESDRQRSAERIEDALVGFRLTDAEQSLGTQTPSLHQCATGFIHETALTDSFDRLAAWGDPRFPRFAIVEPDDSRSHPAPANVLTPREGSAAISSLEAAPVIDLLNSGKTLVLNQAETDLGRPMLDLCDDMATAQRSHSQVNAYLSRGKAPGFGRHWDDHDVVAIQVSGRKYWEVSAPVTLGAIRDFTQDDEAGSVVWSGILESGQALAIPRGWAHEVSGFEDELSFHVTFGIRRPNLVDLLTFQGFGSNDRPPAKPSDADVERGLASWRSRLVTNPRFGPIAYGKLADQGFAGVRLQTRLPGGAVFDLGGCTPETLSLFANRRRLAIPRALVGVLVALLDHPGTTLAEIASTTGLSAERVSIALAGFADAGLLHPWEDPG